MKTSINREYAARHLFACAVIAGLCAWFAYDGAVKYPATPAAELYRSIEKSDPPAHMAPAALEACKAQKTKSQLYFAGLLFLLAAVVVWRLFSASRFSLEFDDDGFSVGGERFAYGDIKDVQSSSWEKKGIAKLTIERAGARRTVVLDAWHHVGAREFFEKATGKTKEAETS